MMFVKLILEMFYLNTIEQLFLIVEQLDQLEVCLPYSRLLTGIPILAVFQNLRWNSNKTSLVKLYKFFWYLFFVNIIPEKHLYISYGVLGEKTRTM